MRVGQKHRFPHADTCSLLADQASLASLRDPVQPDKPARLLHLEPDETQFASPMTGLEATGVGYDYRDP